MRKNVGSRFVTNRSIDSFGVSDTVDIRMLQRSPIFIYSAITERECGRCICTGEKIMVSPVPFKACWFVAYLHLSFLVKDVSGVQPTVYLNGVPLMLENSYVYDIKQFDINPIGAAANMLAGLDISSIESIEIIKRSASACQIRSFSCQWRHLDNNQRRLLWW